MNTASSHPFTRASRRIRKRSAARSKARRQANAFDELLPVALLGMIALAPLVGAMLAQH